MNITSMLYRAARISADFRSVNRAVRTGSPMPVIRRLFNKLWGRAVVSRTWWKGK